MGSFFIEAPIKDVLDKDGVKVRETPDVDFEVEGSYKVLDIAPGRPDRRYVLWHINGSAVTSQAIAQEVSKGRDGFRRGNANSNNKILYAAEASHKFMGEADV